MTVSVVLADDHALVRAGIAALLAAHDDLAVVGEASDGSEAVALARSLHPDVVVMDMQMPGLDGAAATRSIADDDLHDDGDQVTGVLVLTSFDDDESVLGALRGGASGFLLKHAAPVDLANAVRAVAAGGSWIDPRVAGRVVAALSRPTTVEDAARTGVLDRLTPREREVLVLLAHGLSNSEIRERLVLSEATVKTHVARVVMKTGSRDRTQAVVRAYQHGLVLRGDSLS